LRAETSAAHGQTDDARASRDRVRTKQAFQSRGQIRVQEHDVRTDGGGYSQTAGLAPRGTSACASAAQAFCDRLGELAVRAGYKHELSAGTMAHRIQRACQDATDIIHDLRQGCITMMNLTERNGSPHKCNSAGPRPAAT